MLSIKIAVLATIVAGIHAVSMDSKIRDDSDLSQFYHLLEANPVANSTLMYRHVTVFAPTNRAFQKYNGTAKVLYHMANLPKTIENLGDSISSELEGNPPLWVTKKQTAHGEEVYINNAKILMAQSNFESQVKVGDEMKTQVLHVINEVLEPVRSNSAKMISNPNAYEFLNQSEELQLGVHRVRIFRQRVVKENKQEDFKADGRYTFLIPVEEGFTPAPRPEKVDRVVIDGHVIPNHVLFTSPTPDNVPYKTLAFTDNVKVTVSFHKENDKVYVKSNTVMGDANHPMTGVVLAEIVKANIPVRNGVVHLIQRPLMVVDTTVKDFLESFKEKEDGPVYKFYETIRDFGDEIMSTISQLRDVTLFAPSNAALEEPGVQRILQDKERVKEILNLHCVKERLPLDKIKNKSVSQVPTAADRKKLYFNVVQGPRGNQTVTVEGGGVNATVITANIAATNGIIHIIDRVLGVPYTTVLEKLKTDPMLNVTYIMGQRHNFNDQLNDTTKRFTYFAPRDYAWNVAEISYPSTMKKLFMSDYAYHTKQILERHLVIANEAYTMAKLKEMKHNESIDLPAVRDHLKIRVREANEMYQIQWNNLHIRVFRPDVECTNGIIHVIDGVFLKDSDVRVKGSASVISLAPHLIMILVAKWLL